MAIIKKILSALYSPEKIGGYAELQFKKLNWQLQHRSVWQFFGSAIEVFVNKNFYYQLVSQFASTPSVRRQINGVWMDLPHSTDGIARTLIAYGVHEFLSTCAFKRELHRLASTIDGEVTVFEIGANIGYYCLLEAAILGDHAQIYAVEPDHDNLVLLERNIRLNGYENVINVSRLAIGDQSETVLLYQHGNTNRHVVRSPSNTETRHRGLSEDEAITVTQKSAAQFLNEQGVDMQSINVVRMDIEGYERSVFRAIEGILSAPGPTCLFVEVHPRHLSSDDIETLVSRLADNDFEIVSTVASEGLFGVFEPARWHGISQPIGSFNELRTYLLGTDHYLELIVRKGYS